MAPGESFKLDLRVGELTVFVAYITRFYGRMDSMSRMVAAVQRAGASAQRIFAILDRVPSVAEPVKPVHPGRLRGEVEFRGVGFHYGTRPVLSEMNLTVQPGEMIGLVGPSGSGKSTLVNLVCRFYDVSEGRHPGRRRRHPLVPAGRVSPPHRHRAARAVLVLRHHRREHRLRPAGRLASRDHRRSPGRPRRTSSSFACPTATIRWSASEANSSPAASGSGSASPGRC